MTKKKGFTLIELLAVIIIMVIVLVIFAPNILKIIGNTQSDTYLVKEKLISRAGQDYVLLNNITLPTDTGQEKLVNISALIDNNYISKIYDLASPSDACQGYFIAKKNSTYGHTYEACLFCKNYQTDNDECDVARLSAPDISIPTLMPRGDNPYYLELGKTYTDPECSAFTNGNVNISDQVVTSGLGFSTSTVGTHTVTYTLPSSPGLSATRTVVVVDTTSPTITFGTNSNSTPSKTQNTTVTSSDLSGISVLKYLWSTSKTAPSDVSFTNTFTNGSTITGSGLEGTQYLWIYSKDNNNNVTKARSGEFIFDNTAPTIVTAVISSNNGLNNKQAKNGDTLTLSMTFSESISNTPTVTIGGRSATVTGSGASRAATYTIPSNESTLTEGNLGINISLYNDGAGNVGSTVTSVTSGGLVNYDRTVPIYTSFYVGGSGNPSYIGTTNTVLAFSVSGATEMCVSNTSTCSSWEPYAASKAWTLTSGEGVKTVYAWFRDSSDNRIGSYTDTIAIDTQPPQGTIVINNGSTYTGTTSATLTITGADSTAGMYQMCISTSSSNCNGTWETFATTKAYTLASGDGTKTLYLWLKDNAGNSNTTYVDSDTIVLDTTLPTVTAAVISSNNGLNNKQAKNGDTLTLNITFSENILNTPTVTIGGRSASVTGSGTSWIATYTIPSNESTLTEGNLGINISLFNDAVSNTGNAVTNVTSGGLVSYDRTAPVYTSFYIGGSGNPSYIGTTNTVLAFSVSAATEMCVSNTSTCSSWETYAASKAWTLTTGEGVKTVYAWFRDAANNVIGSYTDTIALDTIPPQGTIAINTDALYTTSTSVTLTLTATDATSGIYQSCISTLSTSCNGTWTSMTSSPTSQSYTLASGDGIKILYLWLKDNANNSNTTYADSTSITLDTQPPQGTIVINNGAAYTSSTSVTLALTGTDATSGISQMCISTSSSSCTGTWETFAVGKTYTLTTGDGTKTLYLWLTDNAGKTNPTPAASDSITLDTTAPPGTVVINGGADYTKTTGVTLTISSSDADQMCVSTSSSSCTGSWETYATSKAWTLSSGDGTKTVYIWFKDIAQNPAGPYSDTIVLDTTIPTITAATIVSNNANNKYAKNGDTLTLSITFSENISNNPTVTIGGKTASVSGITNSRDATYTILSNESILTEGTLGINISGYTDAAGNTGSTVTSVTNGGLVTYDRTAPVVTYFYIGGSGNPDYINTVNTILASSVTDATSGNYNMCFTTSSSGCTPTIAYASSYAYTLTSGDNTKTVYADYSDKAGNVIVTPVSDNIILDATPPTVDVATIVSDNALSNKQAKNGDTLTLSITFSENITNTPTVTIGGRNTTVTGSGATRTVTYTIPSNESSLAQGNLGISISGYTDIAANTGSVVTSVTSGGLVNYDRTAPTYTSLYIGGSGVTRVGSTSTTVISSVSGATEMCIKNSGSSCDVADSAWETYSGSKAWTLTSGYGTKTVTAWYRDASNNVIGPYSDTVEYMQGDHSTTYTCKASGYSYDGTSSWITNTSTVIQGSTASAHSNYYGIMYFDLTPIKDAAQDYNVDQITFTIYNNESGDGTTKVTFLYVGSCPTLSYTNQTTYSIGDDGPGSGNKPTPIGTYMASAATTGTNPAVFTIDGSSSWVTSLLSSNSECVYINRDGDSYYWEGYGSKTASPPKMTISWLLKP